MLKKSKVKVRKKLNQQDLPIQLRSLVNWSVGILGESIAHTYGKSAYQQIERTRQMMRQLGGEELEVQVRRLRALKQKWQKLSTGELYKIAHSFSLMLELINRCESAYRTYRLQQKQYKLPQTSTAHPNPQIMYVFTSHPTEARSEEGLTLFNQIQALLEQALNQQKNRDIHENHENQENEENADFYPHSLEQQLRHMLFLLLRIPMAVHGRPSVQDEAAHIYSIILEEKILSRLIAFHQEGLSIFLRSWVGGDKDGHPGVDEKVMLDSLNLSRRPLLVFISERLRRLAQQCSLLPEAESKNLNSTLQLINEHLLTLKSVATGDGQKIKQWKNLLAKFVKQYLGVVGILSPDLVDLQTLTSIFPALVVPLELRDSSDMLVLTLKTFDTAIYRMLMALVQVSKGGNPRWYARGLVISHVESAQDIINGSLLLQKTLGGLSLPVIPLFESEHALLNCTQMVQEVIKDKNIMRAIEQIWHQRFEMMIGYSDTSKENGLMQGRILIAQALQRLDRLLKKAHIIPVFFHGQGGSVERGGGSLQEQTAWWPKSAMDIFKITIQGEMVQRSLASPEIMAGQLTKIARYAAHPHKMSKVEKVVEDFAGKVQGYYRQMVVDPHFLRLVLKATPYSYLEHLKIGSRPTKRKDPSTPLETTLALDSLRAIPWVLCWTQTRILLPSWWGVGSVWQESSAQTKRQLRKVCAENDFFRSTMKVLAFSLAKVELSVWKIYLENSGAEKVLVQKVWERFVQEYSYACEMVRELFGQQELMWYRPWLGMSIQLRSPMIHPLNLLQMLALQREDHQLLRETVTGIACGMMTTG